LETGEEEKGGRGRRRLYIQVTTGTHTTLPRGEKANEGEGEEGG
jgi:hypothetical protein